MQTMKKFAFVLAISVLGVISVNAYNHTTRPIASAVDQILYCKVINNTASLFEYKVGTDLFSIPVGQPAGFAFEENTQILKKDTNGNWINWFVFSSAYANQNVQLSDIINLSNAN
jgi:hypothetical protein